MLTPTMNLGEVVMGPFVEFIIIFKGLVVSGSVQEAAAEASVLVCGPTGVRSQEDG